MSSTQTVNAAKNILAQLKTQLQGINGEGNYNTTVPPENVFVGVPSSEVLPPSIVIGAVNWEEQQVDQVTFTVLGIVEVVGICKSDGSYTDLDYALMFASDIERAIMSDETIGGYVYNPILNLTVGTDSEAGIGMVEIKLSINFDVIKS